MIAEIELSCKLRGIFMKTHKKTLKVKIPNFKFVAETRHRGSATNSEFEQKLSILASFLKVLKVFQV